MSAQLLHHIPGLDSSPDSVRKLPVNGVKMPKARHRCQSTRTRLQSRKSRLGTLTAAACHADGRGFESHQSLRRIPLYGAPSSLRDRDRMTAPRGVFGRVRYQSGKLARHVSINFKQKLDPIWTPPCHYPAPLRSRTAAFAAVSAIGATGFEPATFRPPARDPVPACHRCMIVVVRAWPDPGWQGDWTPRHASLHAPKATSCRDRPRTDSSETRSSTARVISDRVKALFT